MDKKKINRLLEQYQQGTLPQHEQELVEQWLDSLKKEDERKLNLSDTQVQAMLGDIRKRMDAQRSTTVRFHPAFVLKIAATFLVVALAGYILWTLLIFRKHSVEYATRNEMKKVVLQDSSIVWLQPNSKLAYYEKRGEPGRFAELEGEGFFEVRKDPARPFTIQCDDRKVRVLGTSFNLRTDKGNLELKVVTGRVNVSSATDVQGIDVTPKQQLNYSHTANHEILSLNEIEIARVTSRTEYNMKFDRTSMKDIAAKVRDKFGVMVNMDTVSLNTCTVTADLTDQSLRETIRMLAGVLDFEYEIKNGVVTLKGGGCK